MNKKEIASFFDSRAESWDSLTIKSPTKVNKILDIAEISADKTVLDIACGTGVLVPDYLNRNIRKYVGVDLSVNMINTAKAKFPHKGNLSFICADAELLTLDDKFDCIVIYDAFPHFANPLILFENLSKHLKPTGRITIAHSMSRDALTKLHSDTAKNVSTILPKAEDLKITMEQFFCVDICISDENIYVVSGKNKFY